ncbi:hypothetical protein Tfer_3247 [Thermincola ferriacetica]|uniref:ABC-transporter type IV n=1 Tax=Thermincola ferriacetica TaxID=281456 RepID=A0A0L6VY91_9FIRM|nr:hypothetical protein [Thermincola ferriacetica]KNZ68220.1 hypothetical protein Tfer_3247 [Thermincola ferriacetica]
MQAAYHYHKGQDIVFPASGNTMFMWKRFIIYGTIGLVMEFFWTGMGALLAGDWRLKTYSSLWMFLIYGSGVFLEFVHDRIRNWPWLIRGVFWTAIIFAAEYLSGWFLRSIFGVAPWTYTNRYAIDGLIRLDYAPVWFFMGLFFEKLHDYLVYEKPLFPKL